MKKLPLRIIASVMLVISLLTLSGLTATAGTLFESAQSSSCCPADGHDSEGAPQSGPCATPDCPCFACISMILSPVLSVDRSWDGLLHAPLPLSRYQPSAYTRSIDYPPEHA